MINLVTDLDACGANRACRALLQPVRVEGMPGIDHRRIRTVPTYCSSFIGGLMFRLSPRRLSLRESRCPCVM